MEAIIRTGNIENEKREYNRFEAVKAKQPTLEVKNVYTVQENASRPETNNRAGFVENSTLFIPTYVYNKLLITWKFYFLCKEK